MTFKLKPIDQRELAERLKRSSPRGRTSRGAELLEQFVNSGEVAASVDFPSTKERNSVALSAANYARTRQLGVWIRKEGGGSGTELTLINLSKADAATRKAYENRPRPGRRPKG